MSTSRWPILPALAAALWLPIVPIQSARAQTPAVGTLWAFCAQPQFSCPDGSIPQAGLIQATDGNLYGTTADGGSAASTPYGSGTVYRITPAGALTTLYDFCSLTGCTDGANPAGGLIQATDGNFYGATSSGGLKNAGTIFKVTPAGALTTLYSFCAQTGCTDGANPAGGLIQAADGNLYGTTAGAGANSNPVCGDAGGSLILCGTVFKISTTGTLTALYSFCSQANCTDGSNPNGSLIQATDGNFYGTTSGGGAHGAGTVFKVTPGGVLTTLYSFCSQANCADGAHPRAGLIQATNGVIYGTTYDGGTGCLSQYLQCVGTVFQITLAGALTTIHDFCTQLGSTDYCADGYDPNGSLVQAADGNLYGTTLYGGPNNAGTVFQITPGGAMRPVVSSFGTGINPTSGLTQARNGVFYGATGGGNNDNTLQPSGYGTLFSLTLTFPLVAVGCPAAAAQVGIAYSSALPAASGVPPYTFSINGASPTGTHYHRPETLPPGLNLNPVSGAVTGTPTTPGVYTFAAQVTDATGVTDADYSCTITAKSAPPTVKITSGATQTAAGGGTSTTTQPIAFTLTGAAPLTMALTSSNPSLLPAAAIALTNLSCGAPVLACSAVLTVAADQVGSTTITIKATDQFGQAGSATAALTVNKPAPPTVTIGSGASQSISEDASPAPLIFTVTGTQVLTVKVVSSNTVLIPQSGIALATGCGTSVLTCTGTFSVAAGSIGTGTITVSATDPYGQSASAPAEITVNGPATQIPPSHSGGGAFEWESLMALGAIVALRRRSRPPAAARRAPAAALSPLGPMPYSEERIRSRFRPTISGRHC